VIGASEGRPSVSAVAQLVELVCGTWLEGLDEDVGREVESLGYVMADRVKDAVLSLAMFEQASDRPPRALDEEAWDRDRAAERDREDELGVVPKSLCHPGLAGG